MDYSIISDPLFQQPESLYDKVFVTTDVKVFAFASYDPVTSNPPRSPLQDCETGVTGLDIRVSRLDSDPSLPPSPGS